MLDTFLATLSPMLSLFIFIAIGFTVKKLGILPDSSGKVLAKLETWVFFPALSLVTMARNCTPSTITTHIVNLVISCFGVAIAIGLSVFLVRFFVKEKSMEQGVYKYALAFGNSGYVGDPLVNDIHGDLMLSYYKMYTMPVSIAIYTWGLGVMVPKGQGKSGLKKILNPPTVSLFIGIFLGLTGLLTYLPSLLEDTIYSSLDSLKACVGPTAMILAGITIASYDLGEMVKDKKVYVASLLRLIVLPAIIIASLFGIKELINLIFDLSIGNTVLFLCFFAVAAPLGLNTVVFPEAYGGSPKTGAGMAMISHTLCIITIPLLYSLMVLIFGEPII